MALRLLTHNWPWIGAHIRAAAVSNTNSRTVSGCGSGGDVCAATYGYRRNNLREQRRAGSWWRWLLQTSLAIVWESQPHNQTRKLSVGTACWIWGNRVIQIQPPCMIEHGPQNVLGQNAEHTLFFRTILFLTVCFHSLGLCTASHHHQHLHRCFFTSLQRRFPPELPFKSFHTVSAQTITWNFQVQ